MIKYHVWQFGGIFINYHVKKGGKCETFSFCLFNISFGFLLINKFCGLIIETALFTPWSVQHSGLVLWEMRWKEIPENSMSDNYTHFWINKNSPSKKKWWEIIHHSTRLLLFFPTAVSFRDWPAASLHLLILSHHETSDELHLMWEWDLQVSSLTSFILILLLSWKCGTPLGSSLCTVLSWQPKWQTVQSTFTTDLLPGSRALCFQTGSLL